MSISFYQYSIISQNVSETLYDSLSEDIIL